MKKSRKKFLKVFLTVSLSAIFVAGLALVLILEPRVNINGFQSLDPNRISMIDKAMVMTDEADIIADPTYYIGSSIYAPLSSLPQYTVDAFVAVEDKRFYKHKGVDYIRIASAAIKNLVHLRYKEGASTISQQLIKNTHLNNEKKLSRKIQEIRIARDLERRYSKDEIMEMYLNILYFGNNIYGIGTAANIYFGKDACSLTVSESAVLAGIINHPAYYNPYTNYENCQKRKDLVLLRMQQEKKISEEIYNAAIQDAVVIREPQGIYDHYFNNAIGECAELLGCDSADILRNKYRISTYYSKSIQESLMDSIQSFALTEKENVHIAGMILDNRNGRIKAYAGSGRGDYYNLYRQPGSTIKPMISYAPALENHTITPITPILDEKTMFDTYAPNNYKDSYLGWTSVETALSTSSNVCAVKLLEMNGIAYAKHVSEKMGLTFDRDDNHLALALGGMKKGLQLKQIADAYQTFARGGLYKKSSYIKSVHSTSGALLYQDQRTDMRAVGEDTAYIINEMLQKCVREGTAKRLRSIKNLAAKTGTVGTKDGNTDAYCIAYSPLYTYAVWIGSKSGQMPNAISGGTVPATMVRSIIKNSKLHTETPFEIPGSVIKLDIDKDALDRQHKVILANASTPQTNRINVTFSLKNLPLESSKKSISPFVLSLDTSWPFEKKNMIA